MFKSRLLKEDKVHGVLGVGGGTSSLVSTSIMQSLPFGMPKLMASSMAGHPKYVDQYVGTKDINMLNTAVDVVELNPILKTPALHKNMIYYYPVITLLFATHREIAGDLVLQRDWHSLSGSIHPEAW